VRISSADRWREIAQKDGIEVPGPIKSINKEAEVRWIIRKLKEKRLQKPSKPYVPILGELHLHPRPTKAFWKELKENDRRRAKQKRRREKQKKQKRSSWSGKQAEAWLEAVERQHQLSALRRVLKFKRVPAPPPQPKEDKKSPEYIEKCFEERWVKKRKKNRKLHTTLLLRLDAWKSLRLRVFERDGHRCLRCGSDQNLQADHILPKASFPFLTFDINNLQTLCQPCNFWKHRVKSKKSYRKVVTRSS